MTGFPCLSFLRFVEADLAVFPLCSPAPVLRFPGPCPSHGGESASSPTLSPGEVSTGASCLLQTPPQPRADAHAASFSSRAPAQDLDQTRAQARVPLKAVVSQKRRAASEN